MSSHAAGPHRVSAVPLGRAHWNSVAECWHLYTSPLRPSPEDLSAFVELVAAHGVRIGRPARVLLLGVTPEIAVMAWPDAVDITAVDRSPEMIARVWPGDRTNRRARCLDWFDLQTGPDRFDIVIADGALNTIGFPADLGRLLSVVRAVTDRGALLIARTFTQPSIPETPAQLFGAAAAGAAGGFHAFKFRLAMALQTRAEDGVALADVWRAWHELESRTPGLHELNDWSEDVVRTIDLFHDKTVRLAFPSLEELTAALSAGRVSLVDSRIPVYEMGDRCPILAGRL